MRWLTKGALFAVLNIFVSGSPSAVVCAGNYDAQQDAGVAVELRSPKTQPGIATVTIHDGNTTECPVKSIEITYPINGAFEKPPLEFKLNINIRPGGIDHYAANSLVCIEVNSELLGCSRSGQWPWYNQLGECSAQAYVISDDVSTSTGSNVTVRSSPVTFTMVNESEYSAYIAQITQKDAELHRPGFQLSLLDWAQSQQLHPDKELLQRLEIDNLSFVTENQNRLENQDAFFLLVGVRTAIMAHFPFRQAIRETWASKSNLPRGVKVFFLGCRPYVVQPEEADNTSSKFRRIWEAIELEKLVYGDLLTNELDCDDPYFRLADKTKAFFHFAATRYPNAQYVMIADDDLYMRLDEIVARLRNEGLHENYYAGQVRAVEMAGKIGPDRNPNSYNYLSQEQYSLSELPPFALGASFFLSMDCARFVSKNHQRLRDLGGMDDISVALWMLIRQVHPKYFPGLRYLRVATCKDNLVVLSDLTVSAIRIIHSNLASGRRFCHGFQWHSWLRQGYGAPMEKHSYHNLLFEPEELQMEFSLPRSEEGREGIVATISTPSHAGIKVPYLSLNESAEELSRSFRDYPTHIPKCSGDFFLFKSARPNAIRLS